MMILAMHVVGNGSSQRCKLRSGCDRQEPAAGDRNREYLFSAVAEVPGNPAPYSDAFIEIPDDERE